MDEPKKSEQNSDVTNTPSASGQVMDIQSPKTSDTAPPLPSDAVTGVPSFSESPASPSSPNTNDSSASADVDTTPAATQPVSEADQPADSSHNPLAIPPQAAHKNSAPIAAIIVAIIVALALAGLVIFTFMKSKNNSSAAKKNVTPAAQTPAKPLASPADVDATTKDLETGLSKTDDTKDFSATELSDKSLGL